MTTTATKVMRMLIAMLGGLTLAACGGGGGDGSAAGTDAPAPVTAALSQVADCDALRAALQADARAKVHVQAEELRTNGWWYVRPQPIYTDGPQPAPTPSAAAGAPPDATDTNTQVPGVDEADVVETDGERIFLLRNGELLVLPAAPPEATAIGDRIAIEGGPVGMFVADGRALVLSAVADGGSLGGDPGCATIGAPFPTAGGGPSVVPCNTEFVKLTLIDLATAPARIVREVYVEGISVGARRHGSRARVVVQRYWGAPPGAGDPWAAISFPTVPTTEAEFQARVDAWEVAALAAIAAGPLDAWLPAVRERVGGTLVEHPFDCTAAQLPPPGHARQGTTMIVGLDLASDDAPLADTTLFGAASSLYANGDTLVLANPDWQVEPFSAATTRTALHVFTLPADSLDTAYRGSGFVPGDVTSQFAIDVRGDVLRVAVGYWRELDGLFVTRVLTTRIVDGALATIGTTGDIAPGEQLFGTRFLGDTAYLVTFLRTDPLFVVDLRDPTRPTVVGEVEIPGFSEYLHPLAPHHLLTIGRSADQNGSLRGLALKVFDVGDPAAPRLVDDYELADALSSPAEWDHLAFTFDPSRGLLALPLNGYAGVGVAALQLLAVDPAAGITLRGTIVGEPSAPAPCDPSIGFDGCVVPEEIQRGLFLGAAVFAISNQRVRVHTLDDLTTPLVTAPLP